MTQLRPFASTPVESAESWKIQSPAGEDYLVQIGFPRSWGDSSSSDQDQTTESKVPILYLTDGNSVFLTALEALHRRLCASPAPFPQSIVVSIGFDVQPRSDLIFDKRRGRDLTPPSPGCGPNEGGADVFADLIQSRVRPLVHQRLKERRRGAVPGKEALYGHSFGGLFSLHLCFTRPSMFDTFIASSPSIWWHDRFILQEELAFRQRKNGTVGPSLWLSIGGDEQDPARRRGETDEGYEERKKRHNQRQMITNVTEMHGRLQQSDALQNLSFKTYDGEDHGTVIACSVSQSLANFFEDWPFVI
ncbi:unnamed protein product [Clonostachys solani]|uniref:Uncharacterized protein n=1 Tax=Clonostachys solani TaxID=160281 RepID=A0A9N9YQ25_9HYPO|nr:unnamed protein product [Clonostachys solani]